MLPGDEFTAANIARVIAYDSRVTPTGNVTTTETGVFRFDDLPIISGHLYRLTVSNINVDGDTGLDGDNLNQIWLVRLRLATDTVMGTLATTSSTQSNSLRQSIDDATNSNIVPWVSYWEAPADGFLSALWTVVRQGGEAGNIVWFCSSTDHADFVVEDLGPASQFLAGTVI